MVMHLGKTNFLSACNTYDKVIFPVIIGYIVILVNKKIIILNKYGCNKVF